MAGKKKRGTRQRGDVHTHFVRTANYVKVYGTNAISRTTDVDFRIEVLNEKFIEGRNVTYVVDAGILLTPQAAKLLTLQLSALIEEFEKTHGKIPVEEKRLKVRHQAEVAVTDAAD